MIEFLRTTTPTRSVFLQFRLQCRFDRPGGPGKNPRVSEVVGNPVPVCKDFLFLFFSPSEASQAAGRAFWERRHQRKDADPPSSIQTMKAQQAARMEWQEPRGERYAYLETIKQPTPVVNGNDDIMVPTINSFTLSQHIPECTTDCVSGLRTWRALPVSRALRSAREALPGSLKPW